MRKGLVWSMGGISDGPGVVDVAYFGVPRALLLVS
jgi:hypothetical protein